MAPVSGVFGLLTGLDRSGGSGGGPAGPGLAQAVSMWLGAVLLAVLLSATDYSSARPSARQRRTRRNQSTRHRQLSTEVPPSCSRGCDLCSQYNGCLKCLPRLFILLERNDIREIGVCLSSCPEGYFGVRNPDMNKCTRCRIENCEACFSKGFCTKCKEGLYSHRGRCYSSCPRGFSTANDTMECTSTVQCELGEWGPWGPCMKKNKTCGFRKGTQARSREPAQAPSPVTAPSPVATATCPSETESRRCTVRKVPCAGGKEKGKKKGVRGEESKNRESKESKGRSREAKDSRGGGKRKKGHARATPGPPLTPSGTN
ncbi:R-spondin-1 [Conger conger]|uniref:R-spondin-1 n=1 Tax=Conger conger TaxID=82655 RepID=UPI002A59DF2F|nr:R-spondin-1 [Conger conger]